MLSFLTITWYILLCLFISEVYFQFGVSLVNIVQPDLFLSFLAHSVFSLLNILITTIFELILPPFILYSTIVPYLTPTLLLCGYTDKFFFFLKWYRNFAPIQVMMVTIKFWANSLKYYQHLGNIYNLSLPPSSGILRTSCSYLSQTPARSWILFTKSWILLSSYTFKFWMSTLA